jgi:hypothetical protein
MNAQKKKDFKSIYKSEKLISNIYYKQAHRRRLRPLISNPRDKIIRVSDFFRWFEWPLYKSAKF